MTESSKETQPRIPWFKRPWGIALLVLVVIFVIVAIVTA